MNAHTTRIVQGGKVVIPSRIRKAIGLQTGDVVVVDVRDGEVRVRPLSAGIAEAQAIARRYAPDRVLSEELIAERRAEARHE